MAEMTLEEKLERMREMLRIVLCVSGALVAERLDRLKGATKEVQDEYLEKLPRLLHGMGVFEKELEEMSFLEGDKENDQEEVTCAGRC